MNDLLKVNYDTDQPTVSARELHEKGRLFLYDELKKAGYVPLIEKAA